MSLFFSSRFVENGTGETVSQVKKTIARPEGARLQHARQSRLTVGRLAKSTSFGTTLEITETLGEGAVPVGLSMMVASKCGGLLQLIVMFAMAFVLDSLQAIVRI
jgi:hypothetical protein